MSAERGWSRRFEEPVPLPNGRELITLIEAGKYITKLPKTEHEAAEWQAAMEALILVAVRHQMHCDSLRRCLMEAPAHRLG